MSRRTYEEFARILAAEYGPEPAAETGELVGDPGANGELKGRGDVPARGDRSGLATPDTRDCAFHASLRAFL